MVAIGDGPPTLFVTLPWAEDHWKDITRLLKERFRFSDIVSPLGPESKDRKINTVRNVNDFTIVVQEYFQKRIENWLNTVGKTILKINWH